MTVAGRGDGGQATVELAVVLPLVAILALVVAQVGLVVRQHLLVAHATREAVRAAAVAEGDRSVAARRAAERAGPLDDQRLDIEVETVDDGTAVRVTVGFRAITDLPLVGALLPDPRLEDSAAMRIESVGERGP